MSAARFARYDPRAADAKIWRTSEQGKHYEFDTVKKKVTKGNVGQPDFQHKSTPIGSTAPDMGRYQELFREQTGNHQKTAHKYFKEKLQGRHVMAQTDEGPVEAVFTGGTWQELKRDMNRDALKAELVPHMPDIIATGNHRKNAVFKKRRDDAVAFHEYRKIVRTSEGQLEVIVDVMEREYPTPRYMVYSLTREGSRNYADRQKKTPAMDSGPFLRMSGVQDSSAVVGSNISPQFEVVNLRVNVDSFRPFTGPFAGLNRIMVDGVAQR